ncbi:unnamed protein product, partial [Ectocarpus sp. 12 AP-2014]
LRSSRPPRRIHLLAQTLLPLASVRRRRRGGVRSVPSHRVLEREPVLQNPPIVYRGPRRTAAPVDGIPLRGRARWRLLRRHRRQLVTPRRCCKPRVERPPELRHVAVAARPR